MLLLLLRPVGIRTYFIIIIMILFGSFFLPETKSLPLFGHSFGLDNGAWQEGSKTDDDDHGATGNTRLDSSCVDGWMNGFLHTPY
jgi:hypothetical protein